MNPQYIQQQQQQQQHSQQQSGYFPAPPTSPPYGEVNSNVSPNMLKGSPINSQTYAAQKPMQGPPLSNLHQSQAPYYVNNIQTQGSIIYCLCFLGIFWSIIIVIFFFFQEILSMIPLQIICI